MALVPEAILEKLEPMVIGTWSGLSAVIETLLERLPRSGSWARAFWLM